MVVNGRCLTIENRICKCGPWIFSMSNCNWIGVSKFHLTLSLSLRARAHLDKATRQTARFVQPLRLRSRCRYRYRLRGGYCNRCQTTILGKRCTRPVSVMFPCYSALPDKIGIGIEWLWIALKPHCGVRRRGNDMS